MDSEAQMRSISAVVAKPAAGFAYPVCQSGAGWKPSVGVAEIAPQLNMCPQRHKARE